MKFLLALWLGGPLVSWLGLPWILAQVDAPPGPDIWSVVISYGVSSPLIVWMYAESRKKDEAIKSQKAEIEKMLATYVDRIVPTIALAESNQARSVDVMQETIETMKGLDSHGMEVKRLLERLVAKLGA